MSDLPYLKQVSRVKHRILSDYLPAWASILGSRHNRIRYIDCFSGAGQYVDEKGNPLPGSPLIAVRLAQEYSKKRPGRSLIVTFVEKDGTTAEQLRTTLETHGVSRESARDLVEEADANDFVDRLVAKVKGWGPGMRMIPTFFFVDPYGHPITLPKIRELLHLGQNEVFVNLMWFSINMHLDNPKMKPNVDLLFGHTEWQHQGFMGLSGHKREQAFIQYFISEVGATYQLRFPVRFSPEDHVPAGERRNKFYLIHLSEHPKAALLMKEVMWKASDDVAELQFSGRGPEKQLKLFGAEPDLVQLRNDLLSEFRGKNIGFDQIRIQTLDWPFLEKHYRDALKRFEDEGIITIKRVESKKSGLKGRDVVIFP